MPATSFSSRAALSLLASLSGCVADERTSDAQEPDGPASRPFLATVAHTPAPAVSLDTVPPEAYEGWKQYQLVGSRCHGEAAQGSSFGPSLLAALKADGRWASIPGISMACTTTCTAGLPGPTSPGAR